MRTHLLPPRKLSPGALGRGQRPTQPLSRPPPVTALADATCSGHMQIVLHRAFRTGRSHLVKWHLGSDGPGSLCCNTFLLMLPVSCSGTDALAMPSFNVSPND